MVSWLAEPEDVVNQSNTSAQGNRLNAVIRPIRHPRACPYRIHASRERIPDRLRGARVPKNPHGRAGGDHVFNPEVSGTSGLNAVLDPLPTPKHRPIGHRNRG